MLALLLLLVFPNLVAGVDDTRKSMGGAWVPDRPGEVEPPKASATAAGLVLPLRVELEPLDLGTVDPEDLAKILRIKAACRDAVGHSMLIRVPVRRSVPGVFQGDLSPKLTWSLQADGSFVSAIEVDVPGR